MNPRVLTDSYERHRPSWSETVLRSTLRQLRYGQVTVTSPSLSATYGSTEPACVVNVHRPRFFRRALSGGSVGIGESYMDGDWDTDHLVNLIRIFASDKNLYDNLIAWATKYRFLVVQPARWLQRNNPSGSRSNIHAHYDLGNEFFKHFLDKRMMYSCANFDSGKESLDQASELKLRRVCDKLELSKDDHLLEIGSGWGGLAVYAATTTGCRVTTTTISEEQYVYTSSLVKRQGLSKQITVLCDDYRDLTGSFSKVVSIEMIEAVGHQYLRRFFDQCSKLMLPNALLLLQAIVIRDSRYKEALRDIDFIKKYIFPGGFLPSISVLASSAARADLSLLSLDDNGQDYAKTLHHWSDGFSKNRAAIQALGFDERFMRMWEFYLAYCQGGFLERAISDVQMVFNLNGWRGGSVRTSFNPES